MNALNAAQRMQMIEKFETLTIKEYGVLVYENEQLRQRITGLEAERDGEAEDYAQRAERSNGMSALQLWLQNHNRKMTQDAIDDALMEYISHVEKQRDELLAALGSGGRHCNDDTPHSNLCEAIIDSKEADLGQGLDPFWKWAFRRGFHEAETSYKVDITTLEQQRDELLAAAEAIEINAEECLDFDECTAMLVQIDDYHKLMEAIASVNEK